MKKINLILLASFIIWGCGDDLLYYEKEKPHNQCNAREETINGLIYLEASGYLDISITEFRIICRNDGSKVRVEWRVVELMHHTERYSRPWKMPGTWIGWGIVSEYGWRQNISGKYWGRDSLDFETYADAQLFIQRAKAKEEAEREYVCDLWL